MLTRALNVCAVALIIFPFSTIIGGQMDVSSKAVLDGILSSSLFHGASFFSSDCELTAYCPGGCCNSAAGRSSDGSGKVENWSDKIAAGDITISRLHDAGVGIAAVDTSKIPYGSILRYENKLYAALDCGSMIKGDKIDLSMNTHDEALEFGRRRGQKVAVWIPMQPGLVVKIILDQCRQ